MTSLLKYAGKKLYQKAVNAYINKVDPQHKRSRELYEGELHVPLHNFTGPGTRLDLPEVVNFKPYNGIDACSKDHDLEYKEVRLDNSLNKEQKAKKIQEIDQKAIDCYDKVHKKAIENNNPDFDYGYSAAKTGISGKLGVEKLLSILKGKATVLYGGVIVKDNIEGPKKIDLKIQKSLSRLLIAHTKYISNLNIWEKYIVWRYTIGSGQVNRKLIMGAPQASDSINNIDKTIIWTYQFFKYFQAYLSESDIPQTYMIYKKYFGTLGSVRYFNIKSEDKKLKIANSIIDKYTNQLKSIIEKAPKTTETIVVYKASSIYPGLPPENYDFKKDGDFKVEQKPFNSTSYDPTFPFNIFMADSIDGPIGVLWQIMIPKGFSILSINPVYHAYPFEREILLPPGITFNILEEEDVVLDYVDKAKIQESIQVVQDPKSKKGLVIGEVFRLPLPGSKEVDKLSSSVMHKKVKLYTAILEK